MKQAFQDLIKFESACGNSLSEVHPGIPDDHTRLLRVRLISEEYNELMEAINENDIEGIADGIADLCYVALGTAVRFGIDIVPVWEATQAANMAKLGEGSYRRADGKLMKPPVWEHADIEGILDAQKPLAELYSATGRPPEGESA